jgi:C-terminal processing protease CtpA/Prc
VTVVFDRDELQTKAAEKPATAAAPTSSTTTSVGEQEKGAVTLGYASNPLDDDASVSGSASPSKGTVRMEVQIKRRLVRMSDVRLATFLGDPEDGVGYINLAGFNSGAGRDFRQAFAMLRLVSD